MLIVFDNGPQTAAVAKAVGIEKSNPLTVNATDDVVAVDAIYDNNISVISVSQQC